MRAKGCVEEMVERRCHDIGFGCGLAGSSLSRRSGHKISWKLGPVPGSMWVAQGHSNCDATWSIDFLSSKGKQHWIEYVNNVQISRLRCGYRMQLNLFDLVIASFKTVNANHT